jgi:2-polyprenyl-3-methyl-5-hydroxy-6-metoxy-1,4-benzoquinol methylase
VPNAAGSLAHVTAIREFFDQQYAAHGRYWWQGENRYSVHPADHTAYNATWLTAATSRSSGRALDIGAGEGADAIRLARLGYRVDAIEISTVACEKTERFARTQGVRVNIRNEPIEMADLPSAAYDLVLMNGCLHYVRDKESVLRRVIAASTPDAVHAVALFSTATPVPAEHAVIPVFPEDEDGTVERFYRGWRLLLHSYERGRAEHSHPGFAPHVHSHVKLVAARTLEPESTDANF